MSTSSKTPGKKSTKPRKPGTGIHIRPARKVAQLVAAEQAAEHAAAKAAEPKAKKPKRPPAEIDGDAERIDRFAEHYLVHLNQAEAYKAAGFTKSTNPVSIGSLATTYMRRPEVIEAIRRKKAERAEAEAAKGGGALTKDKVLGILNKMLDHDPRKMFKDDGSLKLPHEMDDSAAMVLTSFEQDATYIGAAREGEAPTKVVTKKVKTSGRDAPLQLAMRHLGMLDDKLRLVVTGSVKVHDMAKLALLTDDELDALERITQKLQGIEE
jgi:phage terminase small subunit